MAPIDTSTSNLTALSKTSYGLRYKRVIEYSEQELADFLHNLDEADSVEVTDWEAEFIESNIIRKTFTSGQRVVIERMMDKYGHRIK